MQTNSLREVDLRRVETDKINTKVITKALVLSYHQPFSSPSMDTSQLKTLSRFRFKLVEQRSRVKVSLVNCLDLVFPEYASFFKALLSTLKLLYAILKRYSSAVAIANARLDGLSNIISKYRKNSRSPLDLKNLAKSSVGIHSDSLVTQMLIIIDQIEFFSKQIDVIEQDIKKEINFIDTPLMTIPGISFTISSTILGEINSINRFKDSSKLLAFCGLNPTIH